MKSRSSWCLTSFVVGATLCLGGAISLGTEGYKCEDVFQGCAANGCVPQTGICQDGAGDDQNFDGYDNSSYAAGHCSKRAFYNCVDTEPITVCTTIFYRKYQAITCATPVCYLTITSNACNNF